MKEDLVYKIMNTHLLIPIKDIQEEISHNRKYLNSLQRNERSNDSDKLEQKTEFLEDLLTNKQISLDDKGIEEKAENFYQSANDSTVSGFVDGYTQALKDLL